MPFTLTEHKSEPAELNTIGQQKNLRDWQQRQKKKLEKKKTQRNQLFFHSIKFYWLRPGLLVSDKQTQSYATSSAVPNRRHRPPSHFHVSLESAGRRVLRFARNTRCSLWVHTGSWPEVRDSFKGVGGRGRRETSGKHERPPKHKKSGNFERGCASESGDAIGSGGERK